MADKANTWAFGAISLNFSFCNVPNFCSSSYIINPKFLNFNLSLNNACVPIRMSIFPSTQSVKICFFSFDDTKPVSYTHLTLPTKA